MPSMERVRFVSSGTEAAMSAVRVARAFTGRDRIIKFEGCYHGHADAFLVKAGSGATDARRPDEPGRPGRRWPPTRCSRATTTSASVDALLEAHGAQIAAIIVEPIAGNMGVVPPADGFLAGLRERCTRHGILLIFDEVISGFRAAPGGAQAIFGVRPDLTCLGKIIGGGLPVGAYGGRADIMEMVAPAGPVYQAGTLSGNPVAMTAGLWALKRLTPKLYKDLARRGSMLAAGLADAARDAGVPLQVNAFGSLRHAVLHQRRRCATTTRRWRPTPSAYARVLPGHAGARHLSAAVTVRGVVPVGRAHRPRRHEDDRRRARRDEGCRKTHA